MMMETYTYDNQWQPCYRTMDSCQSNDFTIEKRSTKKRNERERNRVKHINSTFTVLRRSLPTSFGTRSRKLSKVDTLRSAALYIKHLQKLLSNNSSTMTPVHATPEVVTSSTDNSCQFSTSPSQYSPTSMYSRDCIISPTSSLEYDETYRQEYVGETPSWNYSSPQREIVYQIS